MITEQQHDAAVHAGRYAGANRLPLETCPYREDTDDSRALAQAWVRAWGRYNTAAGGEVDYGDDDQGASVPNG